jgi:hypothetical protein
MSTEPVSTQPAETLQLITRADENFSRGDRLALINQTLDVGVLRDRFEDFMAKLQSIVRSDEQRAGAFRLAEIQFSAEIGADGEFKLLGTGVGVSAKSGITFVLRRDEPGEPGNPANSAPEPELGIAES